MDAMRLEIETLFKEIEDKHRKSQELMQTDWIAELPRVYQQHKLEPLCESKVYKVLGVWDKMYCNLHHSFKMVLQGLEHS